ncbi:MAG TPA: hypothetical protein VM074_09860 [Solimonas sp.]|nr:hypothetical protein [Solimonas sp.]
MIRALVALLLACAAAIVQAQDVSRVKDEVLRFYGYGYDLASNAYIYTEVHAQRIVDGRWAGGTITFFAPDGSRIGVKTLDFKDDPYVPVYRLDLEQDGYYEAITSGGDPMMMERRNGRERKLESAAVAKVGSVCADSGFHSFIRDHFKELLGGQTLKLRLAVAGSLDTFRFRMKRIGDTRFGEQPGVRFLVEPDSLLRFVVDPLELTYETSEMKLLEFRGISNVHDPHTGRQYTARVAYYAKPPAEAPKSLPPLE